MPTRTIGATEFKAKCLALLDEVAESGQEIVVTKRGRPVARIVRAVEPGYVDLRGSVLYEAEDAFDSRPNLGRPCVIVVDTHAWFWFIAEPRKLSSRGSRAIEQADAVVVPSIVCLEVLTIENLQRIRFDRPPLQWLRDALARPRTEVAEISPEIAAQAVAFSRVGGGDPFDNVIAATAIVLGVPLISRDERIASLPGIRTIW